jgi:hypothetical protein
MRGNENPYSFYLFSKTGETIDKETTIQDPYLKQVVERLWAVRH